MKIKNRLFISNILMIVTPIVLISLVLYGLMITFSGVPVNKNFRFLDQYFDSLKELEFYTVKWERNPDVNIIKSDVDEFNKKYADKEKKLYVLKGKDQIYPKDYKGKPFDLFLQAEESSLIVVDQTAIIRKRIGEYDLILLDTDFLLYRYYSSSNYNNVFMNYGILTFMVTIIIIYLTDHFLIGFVYKGIENSLDTLAYGVNQIRDGNLTYRIKYEKKDEFAQICTDFNEMAGRLLDSVNKRQEYETNRKELIAGISHDLRTPLTSIKAYVEGLEKGIAATPETESRYLSIIQRKTDDLTHIVNQLFMFSKLDIGEFPIYKERIDIGKELDIFIRDVFDEYLEKGLVIILFQNISGVYIDADIVQLKNAFGNILENGLKYKNKEIGKMAVACNKSEGAVIITFTDDGPGVSNEETEKIFELFYQSDPSRNKQGKGSGLGLAITSKILERLDGDIRARNSINGGLEIIITLPVKNIHSEVDE